MSISEEMQLDSKLQTIAIFYSEIEKDFHVIRKDKEGGWSHKLGYELPPKKDGLSL